MLTYRHYYNVVTSIITTTNFLKIIITIETLLMKQGMN